MSEETPQLHRFVIEAVDPETDCVVTEAKLQAADVSEIIDILGPDIAAELLAGSEFDLDPDEVERLRTRFDLAFEPGGTEVRIRLACPLDDLPYQVHTGRELALMLEGRKPLAAFWDAHAPAPDQKAIPERLFDPHVAAGRFIKRERIFQENAAGESAGRPARATREGLYAPPPKGGGDEGYLLLSGTATKRRAGEGQGAVSEGGKHGKDPGECLGNACGARLGRGGHDPSARQRASQPPGEPHAPSVRRRGSGGIGSAQGAQRPSTGRAPGRV